MTNKVIGLLEAVGRDFKKELPFLIRTGGAVVTAFAPELGPLFNKVANSVLTAEQNFAAIGKQSGTGESKAASVIAVCGNLIEADLTAAGKSATAADIAKYVDDVVGVLNLTPAPAAA